MFSQLDSADENKNKEEEEGEGGREEGGEGGELGKSHTQVKVNGPVHARSKHARYMHNDAQV